MRGAVQALTAVSTLVIDLGKTACRIRIGPAEAEASGAAGLAEQDGHTRAISAVERVLSKLPATALASVVAVGIGAAGFDANPEAGMAFAQHVARRLRSPTAITSDVVTAHLGALDGAPGTVLVVGTGAVAWSINAAGVVRRADGWGIWLGDEGSGRWIGREGLAAALCAADGRGAETTLRSAAIELAGSIGRLPRIIGGDPAPERQLASFAPTVLAHATAGDPVANAVIGAAIRHLVVTATAVSSGVDPISVLGGLTRDPSFAAQLGSALLAEGLHLVQPVGDALAGAATVAIRTDLPHERCVLRV